LPRLEQRDDGFGPNPIAAHQRLNDRIGKHFAEREFAVDKTPARGFAQRHGLEFGHDQTLSKAGAGPDVRKLARRFRSSGLATEGPEDR